MNFRLVPLAIICSFTLSGGAAIPATETRLSADELTPDILQSYIYGFAPVMMEATRAIFTAVPDATSSPGRAPTNQFGSTGKLATPESRLVVRPNADTLYTTAWLDLSQQPIVLHVPDTAGRFFVIPIYDAYSNEFASIGSRTTGSCAGDFAIVGPRWDGILPDGLAGVFRAQTNTVWVIGRTLVHGIDDLPAAIAVTKQYQLIPLVNFPSFLATGVFTPPTDVLVDPPNPEFVASPPSSSPGFSLPAFFNVLSAYFRANRPPRSDEPQARELVWSGLAREAELSPDIVAQAKAAFAEQMLRRSVSENGWHKTLDLGTYGQNYLLRAAVADSALGANIPADSIEASTTTSIDGNSLLGTNNYVLHFGPGQTPPVKGFWSLTLYDQMGFLVVNPISRYSLGSESGLIPNADGSMDIFIQHTPPAFLQSNWLSAPLAPFSLTLRFYWPKQSILDGSYLPPPVTLATSAAS